MGSLSKAEVLKLINEEAENTEGEKSKPEGGLAGAVFSRIGGMITPKRKGGKKAANRGDYLRFVADEQSAGRKAPTFAEWARTED